MVSPEITKKLKGSLGELYYKEYCDQRGWAYISLENIYTTINSKSKWIFTFKKGFHRIQVNIPREIQGEINMLVKPTNNSLYQPSFVFDFLACRVKNSKHYSGIINADTFVWAEIKTGPRIFSSSQINAMSKIKLPLAIFHIDDILESPVDIQMQWDKKPGKEWMEHIERLDNEIYEYEEPKQAKKV